MVGDGQRESGQRQVPEEEVRDRPEDLGAAEEEERCSAAAAAGPGRAGALPGRGGSATRRRRAPAVATTEVQSEAASLSLLPAPAAPASVSGPASARGGPGGARESGRWSPRRGGRAGDPFPFGPRVGCPVRPGESREARPPPGVPVRTQGAFFV